MNLRSYYDMDAVHRSNWEVRVIKSEMDKQLVRDCHTLKDSITVDLA
jgi:hypothetical protein